MNKRIRGLLVLMAAVTIPGNVIVIGEEAFWVCEALTDFTVAEQFAQQEKIAFVAE